MSTAIAANLQLNAVGPIDDEYLTKDPNTSLFSNEYEPITRYARNTTVENFNEVVNFSRTVTCNLPYQGDFLGSISLEIELPSLDIPSDSTYATWTNSIGFALIEQIDIYIGEILIDRQDGLIMEMYDYLTTNASQSHDQMIGRFDNVLSLQRNVNKSMKLLVPIYFWFCRKPLSNALPLASMRKSSIKIVMKIRKFEDLITYDGPTQPIQKNIKSCSLICDYYMLDKAEKFEYINSPQTSLIHQWIPNKTEVAANVAYSKVHLNVEKPVKELILCVQECESVNNNDYFNFGNRTAGFYDPATGYVDSIGLIIDGNPRFSMLPEMVFRKSNEYYHTFSGNRNIYVISFAEKPEDTEPTGTINMSRFQNIELSCLFQTPHPNLIVNIYALTYNVINFENGYPTLEFVN